MDLFSKKKDLGRTEQRNSSSHKHSLLPSTNMLTYGVEILEILDSSPQCCVRLTTSHTERVRDALQSIVDLSEWASQ
jgi:hypothetical protein